MNNLQQPNFADGSLFWFWNTNKSDLYLCNLCNCQIMSDIHRVYEYLISTKYFINENKTWNSCDDVVFVNISHLYRTQVLRCFRSQIELTSWYFLLTICKLRYYLVWIVFIKDLSNFLYFFSICQRQLGIIFLIVTMY